MKPGGRGPRGLTPEDRRVWDRVTATVAPRHKAAPVQPPPLEPAPPRAQPKPATPKPAPAMPAFQPPLWPKPPAAARARPAPETLEPRRQRRLSRERDPIEASIDLHGFSRFEAQDALTGFLVRAQGRGLRAVLVVTGQGRRGGGVIRASLHDWLHAPPLRAVVSGFAPAHRRHGGDGAFYVTLRPRP